MTDELLLQTTFEHPNELGRANAALERIGAGFQRIDPTEALTRVALPALVMNREVRGLLEAEVPDLICSGWVEHRPTKVTMPAGPAPEGDEAPFGRAAITVLTPCVADETKIRFIAHLSGDLGRVMPYLNSMMSGACYSKQAQTLTLSMGHRMVVLYPRRIAVAKADEIVDAWLTLESLRQQACETWARRAEIEPSYETRKRPPALEVFKRLPGTNCGLCGEITCMAFAMRLWSGHAEIGACSPVFEPGQDARKAALLEICAGLGIATEGF
jgi:ArsR family metal-binding transcriptional regulator